MPRASRVNPDAVCFGKIIQRHRLARGWDFSEFGRFAAMNPTYLRVLEKGGNTPTLQTVLHLAEVFRADPAEWVREIATNRKVWLSAALAARSK